MHVIKVQYNKYTLFQTKKQTIILCMDFASYGELVIL